MAATVRTTLSSVGEGFTVHRQRNPVKMADRSMVPSMQQMIREYGVVDPPTKQEAALPLSVLKEAYLKATSSRKQQHANLIIGAFFFDFRSCEYLVVTGTCKTTTIRVSDVWFFKDKVEIRHSERTTF